MTFDAHRLTIALVLYFAEFGESIERNYMIIITIEAIQQNACVSLIDEIFNLSQIELYLIWEVERRQTAFQMNAMAITPEFSEVTLKQIIQLNNWCIIDLLHLQKSNIGIHRNLNVDSICQHLIHVDISFVHNNKQ